MRKITVLGLTLFFILVAIPSAMADSFQNRQRKLADSYYRMSQKAYRNAIKNYGNDLSEIPPQEKSDACTKIRRALLYNKNNYISEDLFRQKVLQKQINDLKQYQLDFGCPKTDNEKKKIGGAIQIGL